MLERLFEKMTEVSERLTGKADIKYVESLEGNMKTPEQRISGLLEDKFKEMGDIMTEC